MNKPLNAKILENKEGKIMLEIRKQKISLDSDELPDKAVKGKALKLYLFNAEETITDKKLAKTILEEILNGK